MNMKRIVFAAVGILVMLVIIFWMLHSIAHVSEINQKRREKNQGEVIASRMIQTTATTNIWEGIRQRQTEESETNTEPAVYQAETMPEEAETESETGMAEAVVIIPQTITETVVR